MISFQSFKKWLGLREQAQGLTIHDAQVLRYAKIAVQEFEGSSPSPEKEPPAPRIYTFTGPGITLGATLVIIANRRAAAIKAAEEWASSMKLKPLKLESACQLPKGTTIVYEYNGEY